MPTVLVTRPISILMQNSPFSSLTEVATIASTHFAYPWRDDQAELAWVGGWIPRRYACEWSPSQY